MKDYPFPVYKVQDTSLAHRDKDGKYHFLEKPLTSGFKIGDYVPGQWRRHARPANELAKLVEAWEKKKVHFLCHKSWER